jgi:hypothetical protein
MRTIELTFSKVTGECVVEAQGFHGSGCKDATAFLRDTLGAVKDFKEKAEWYEVNLELSGGVNSNLCG